MTEMLSFLICWHIVEPAYEPDNGKIIHYAELDFQIQHTMYWFMDVSQGCTNVDFDSPVHFLAKT